MRIGIDPGHGGRDPGAVGPVLQLLEKDVNLDISLRVAKGLRERGIEVVITRESDTYVSLGDRVNVMNKSRVDVVLSIHINSSHDPRPNYLAAFVFARGGRAEEAAESLMDSLSRAASWSNGGIRTGDYYILRKTSAPAVLLELGFISNPDHEQALSRDDTRKAISEAILEGLLQYTGGLPDVRGHWAEAAIRQVVERGIMSGYPDGTFRPDTPATRAELASAIARLLGQLQ